MSNHYFILSLFLAIRGAFKLQRRRNRGKKHEELVFAAFRRRKKDSDPWSEAPWIQWVEQNPRDHGCGYDAIVHMDAGIKAYVQIKSSEKGAERFREDQRLGRYPKRIVVVVIDDDKEHLEPEDIRRIIATAVKPIYQRELQKLVLRAKQRGVDFVPA